MEGLKEKKIIIDAKTPKQLQQSYTFNRSAYIKGGKLPGPRTSHRARPDIENRPRMDIESAESIKAKPMDTVPSLLNYIMVIQSFSWKSENLNSIRLIYRMYRTHEATKATINI